MSDRCNAWVTCLQKHIPDFEATFDYIDDKFILEPNWVELGFYDVDYGGTDLFEQIKLPFFGGHGHGGNYGEHVFVSDGKIFIELPAEDGTPIIKVPENMILNPTVLQEIENYYQFLYKVKNMLGIP